MVLVKANEKSEAGVMPSDAEIVAMGKFNEELIKAGVMVAGDGLHPSSKGARITNSADGKSTVTDGPFTETKELLSGFWMVQMKSREECIEWFKRCPPFTGELEIRQVFDAADFEPHITSDEGRATLQAEADFRKAHG
jgi:hypothetical protein